VSTLTFKAGQHARAEAPLRGRRRDEARLARPPAARAVTVATLTVLAWGGLAFGAVYPWAYWPLLAGVLGVGFWGLFAANRATSNRLPRAIVAGLALTMSGVLIQLVPLPAETLARVSPTTHVVLQDYDVPYATGQAARHSLSINPGATLRGLAFIGSFGLLFLGLLRLVPRGGARALCLGIVGLATLLALVGIVQQPLYAGKIYGLWEPEMRGAAFGPFVNKNHFAGWMIMALSLSLGYYCGTLATAGLRMKTSLRDRILWLSSPEANQLILIGVCLTVMALSLVLTLSRSGISCLALAVVVAGIFAITKRANRSRAALIGGYLTVLVVVVVGWAGTEVIISRFASADWSEFNDRLGAWKDAWQIAMRFMPFGAGLNTYGTTTLFFQTIDPSQHYAEAHNDYLQLLAEGGLLVTIPLALMLAAGGHLIWKRFRAGEDDVLTSWIRIGAVTGIMAMALQETVDFSLQMPGNAVLFTVLAAIAAHRADAGMSRLTS
jgi:O-antigen ligase